MFASTFRALCADTQVVVFHLQEGLIFHLVHLHVPSSDCVNLIWEALQSGGGVLWHRKDNSDIVELFLFSEASTRLRPVYQIMHH